LRPETAPKREIGHPSKKESNTVLPITTLAAFKRALKPGTRWETRSSHRAPNDQLISIWEEKEVIHAQSNAVAFSIGVSKTAIAAGKQNPHRNGSWLWFPKASACTFTEGSLRITHNNDAQHWREYRPVQEFSKSPIQ
jgi:hypothetical protein